MRQPLHYTDQEDAADKSKNRPEAGYFVSEEMGYMAGHKNIKDYRCRHEQVKRPFQEIHIIPQILYDINPVHDNKTAFTISIKYSGSMAETMFMK
jgi:hypothetical protein